MPKRKSAAAPKAVKKRVVKKAAKRKATKKAKRKTATKTLPWRFNPTADHAADVAKYCKLISTGKLTACVKLKQAVNRHLADMKTGKRRGLVFDELAALRAVNFIELLKLTKGEFEGKPFRLEVWQKFIVFSLFGWKHAKTGLRRFREAFISMGRGNGKTPFAAALLLLLCCADQPPEPRAEIKIAATEREQARLCFDTVKAMIRKMTALSDRCELLKDVVLYRPLASTIVPLGGEGGTKDGYNLSAFVADEIHAFKEEHRPLLSALDTAMGKRRQPLAIFITTAGSDRSKIWLERYDVCAKTLSGVAVDDGLFAFIAEIDPEDDPFNAGTWPKANPNFGLSVKPDHLQRMANRAKVNAAFLFEFVRFHCNRLVRSQTKPIQPAIWAAGTRPSVPLERDIISRPIFGGLDTGWRNDLASLYFDVPLGPREDGKPEFWWFGWNWIPSDTERDLDREPWRSWIQSGRLIVTEGNTTDHTAILDKIDEIRRTFWIKSLAFDQNNARAVGTAIANDMGISVYPHPQTSVKYNEPIRDLLDCLADKRGFHDGDPVLAFAADNLVLQTDPRGLVRPNKEKSAEKIDPIVALLMAHGEAIYDGACNASHTSKGGGAILI